MMHAEGRCPFGEVSEVHKYGQNREGLGAAGSKI